MKGPKHVYINAQWSERPLQAYEDEDGWDVPPSRYTLTRGEEWDELWSAAQTHFRSLSEHREELLSDVVESFIAYFEETK